jgi:hypothetical protein
MSEDIYHPDKVRSNLYFALSDAVQLMCALELILPMAKGYAATHDVGNNKWFIKSAETTLDKFKKKHPEYCDVTGGDFICLDCGPCSGERYYTKINGEGAYCEYCIEAACETEEQDNSQFGVGA